MLRSYRRFIYTGFGCLIGSVLIWVAFSPSQPNLPFHPDSKPQPTDYQAGGSNCSPEVLARLTGEKGASERKRCTEAAEQYRLQTSDLIQQTRAADAAQASAWSAYESNRITLAGLIGGFLTLVAALFAAYYARRAYLENKRSADIAEEALKIETRPFLHLESIDWIESEMDGELHFRFQFNIKNIGKLPANNVRVWTSVVPTDAREGTEHEFNGPPLMISTCPAGVTRKVFDFARLDLVESNGFNDNELGIALAVRVIFDTRFRRDKVIDEFRYAMAYGMRQDKTIFLDQPKMKTQEPDLFDRDTESTANDDSRNRGQ